MSPALRWDALRTEDDLDGWHLTLTIGRDDLHELLLRGEDAIARMALDEALALLASRVLAIHGDVRRVFVVDLAEDGDDGNPGAVVAVTTDVALRWKAAGLFVAPDPTEPLDTEPDDDDDDDDDDDEPATAGVAEPEGDDTAERIAHEPGTLHRLPAQVDGVAVVGGALIAAAGQRLHVWGSRGRGAPHAVDVAATALAFDPRGVLVGDARGMLHRLDGTSVGRSLPVVEDAIRSIAVGRTLIAIASDDVEGITVLDAETWRTRTVLTGSNGAPWGLVVLRDDLVAGGDQVPVEYRFWSAVSGQVVRAHAFPRATNCMTAALSPDDTRLAILTDVGGGIVVDAATLDPVAAIEGGWACAWRDAGTLIASELEELHELSRDGVLRTSRRPCRDAGNVSALWADEHGLVVGYEHGALWIEDQS